MINDHDAFIKQCVHLRNNLFAHTNHHAAVHEVHGFNGLTIDMFESYWGDIASAALAVERAVFGGTYGPQIDVGEFKRSGDEAVRFLNTHQA